jgi:hypothetical protein
MLFLSRFKRIIYNRFAEFKTGQAFFGEKLFPEAATRSGQRSSRKR